MVMELVHCVFIFSVFNRLIYFRMLTDCMYHPSRDLDRKEPDPKLVVPKVFQSILHNGIIAAAGDNLVEMVIFHKGLIHLVIFHIVFQGFNTLV